MNTNLKEKSFTLREEIDRLLGSGDVPKAYGLLKSIWEGSPGPAMASFVISRFLKMRPELDLVPCKISFLRSLTLEPVVPVLRAALSVKGIDLKEHLSDFNAYAQEILDEKSKLYEFSPDIIVLAVQTRDILPDIWTRFPDLSSDEIETQVDRVSQEFRSWVQTIRTRCKASLILHTLEIPSFAGHGVLGEHLEVRQSEAISSINREFYLLARDIPGVYILNYDALIARHGRFAWHDEHKWLTMRMPIAADCLIHLATEWLRYILPLKGKGCKVLVTDADNTLWGGVIGEDGSRDIQVGPDYPGAAYQALQRAMLDLRARGIILAICSKNNSTDVMEVIEHHEGMLLRPHHFAAIRINWQNKAQNLVEIAEELSISLDAIAFMDDNPFECQLVRNQLPDVTVIELPEGPMEYASLLRENPVFEKLSLSSEDRERGSYYLDQQQRNECKQNAPSLEEFYYSIQIVMDIALLTPETLARTAQLTQKTNQFNLTTRRYSEQQINEMSMKTNWRIYTMRSRDRFGDHGIVGVAIISFDREVCEIDTFLLSCRVIGQTLETAFLATIIEQVRAEGLQRLNGWFLPTPKNLPAKDFYESHGFKNISVKNDKTCWELDLRGKELVSPPWVKRNIKLGEIK